MDEVWEKTQDLVNPGSVLSGKCESKVKSFFEKPKLCFYKRMFHNIAYIVATTTHLEKSENPTVDIKKFDFGQKFV